MQIINYTIRIKHWLYVGVCVHFSVFGSRKEPKKYGKKNENENAPRSFVNKQFGCQTRNCRTADPPPPATTPCKMPTTKRKNTHTHTHTHKEAEVKLLPKTVCRHNAEKLFGQQNSGQNLLI